MSATFSFRFVSGTAYLDCLVFDGAGWRLFTSRVPNLEDV
jgi:hypothetical protein